MANDLNEASIKFIVETVREALRNDGPTPQPGALRMPEDDRFRSMVEEIIDRKLAAFEKTLETVVHREIENSLRRIGIRIDDEHVDQTAEDVRSMMRTHKTMNRIGAGLGVTLVSGVVFGLLKLLGLKLGGVGGEH